ncbi:type I-E CRISPR-associated protein Cas5/CasD [Williamsia sp. CHRR-6]|uniref:type I-E CRISPR-associated protein Cas5/CasD n=1 Tax=Williamsia sp. CHRR-6 TaxID=2835871 RepID=UPI001BDB135B|nr:type I-E CRISPR-associated protein Cas5/CasD [Williamsia sp. CHRR-6]MBT0566992.1 type I-E CRISPR-associated protein Cas5/CasD [Williamsia sp. CHRR-6]
MSTLVVCLAGPMQAWGASSRFTKRDTRREPTKSGVIGLLAAAQGLRRADSIEHLLGLRFGVRVDREGTLMRDFQTARSLDEKKTMPLSTRYYLADAIFVAGVEGPADLIGTLADALRRPVFPLFLGRRSCPPSRPPLMTVADDGLDAVLTSTPWQAPSAYTRRQAREVRLRIVVDGVPGVGVTVRDQPISFDPRRREYGWRTTEESYVTMLNPDGRGSTSHDPMSLLGGA